MKNLCSALTLCILLFACSNNNTQESDLIASLIESGVLTSCGSVPTGCNGACPSGQYCQEFQNGWCFCVRGMTEEVDSISSYVIGLAQVDCACNYNGKQYSPGDYLCIEGQVNRCIYEPTSNECEWYNWGVSCNDDLNAYYASISSEDDDDERETSSIRVTNLDPVVNGKLITLLSDQSVSVYEYKHGPCSWTNTLFKRTSDNKIFKCSQGGGSCRLEKGTYLHYFEYNCRQSPTNRMYTITSTVGYN